MRTHLVTNSSEMLPIYSSSHTALPPQTDVVVVIWGERFWDFFVNVSLPSQTGPQNVVGFKLLNARWRFFCRPAEFEKYRTAPSMQRLESLFTIDIIDLSRMEQANEFQYHLMTRCHQQAVCEAEHAIVFLSPDVVSSGNAYLNVAKIVSVGARAVLCQGLRIVKESFLSTLRHDIFDLTDLKPYKLVKIALCHLHPITKAFFLKADNETNYSLGSYMWIDHKSGILAHCFHLHPVFVWPNHKRAKILTTVDHELVRLSITDVGSIVIVDDSNDLLLCEVSEKKHLEETISSEGISISQAAGWAKDYTNYVHRNFFSVPIMFRVDNIPFSRDILAHGQEFTKKFLDFTLREYKPFIGEDMYVARAVYSAQGAYVI